MRYETYLDTTTGLARRSPVPGLGTETARLEQRDIAAALGVSPGAVSQWLKAARMGGEEALRNHPAPSPTPRLSQEQLAQIPAILAKGADYYGFIGEVWTAPRIARVVKDHFGVRYHPSHIRRLLKAAGWSRQKPIQRATQRDEEAIEKWYAERWPAIERGPRQKVEPSSG